MSPDANKARARATRIARLWRSIILLYTEVNDLPPIRVQGLTCEQLRPAAADIGLLLPNTPRECNSLLSTLEQQAADKQQAENSASDSESPSGSDAEQPSDTGDQQPPAMLPEEQHADVQQVVLGEIAPLKDDVAVLKNGQQVLQDQLNTILQLLQQQRAVAQPAAPPEGMAVDGEDGELSPGAAASPAGSPAGPPQPEPVSPSAACAARQDLLASLRADFLASAEYQRMERFMTALSFGLALVDHVSRALHARHELDLTDTERRQLEDSAAQQRNLGSSLPERTRPRAEAIDAQLRGASLVDTPEVGARLIQRLNLGGAGHGSQGTALATVGTTATPSTREEKVPISKFTGTLDKHITCLRTWFDVLVSYFTSRGIDPITNFIFYVAGPAQQWAVVYFRERKDSRPTVEQLRTDFLTQWDHPHRDTPEDVRNKLLAGEVKQTGGIQAYIASFRILMQNAGEMHMHDRIAYFKHGLTPALYKKVAHQSDGSRWTDLEDLIKYTVSVALAEQSTKSTSAPARVNMAQTPSRDPRKPPKQANLRPNKSITKDTRSTPYNVSGRYGRGKRGGSSGSRGGHGSGGGHTGSGGGHTGSGGGHAKSRGGYAGPAGGHHDGSGHVDRHAAQVAQVAQVAQAAVVSAIQNALSNIQWMPK